VEAERGDLKEAIAQMRAVVADDPHFYRGWAELARWCEQAGDHAGYRDAAQKLTRLDPQNPLSFAVLAGARLRSGDRPGAKAALRRAFELAPDYAYAGMTLFDMLVEDGELQPAGELLQRLRTHIGGEWVLAREVQLAARRGDAAMALLHLRELCAGGDGEPWPLHAAAQAMAEAGWSDSLDQALEEALDRPGANPQAGALWVRSRLSRGDWSAATRLPDLQARGAIGVQATSTPADRHLDG
jgi:Flp pilus assembly protein TadD